MKYTPAPDLDDVCAAFGRAEDGGTRALTQGDLRVLLELAEHHIDLNLRAHDREELGLPNYERVGLAAIAILLGTDTPRDAELLTDAAASLVEFALDHRSLILQNREERLNERH